MMKEQISAWIDGELPDGEARRVSEVVARQTVLQAQCGTLWLIGDVIRDEAALSANFTDRVMAALSNEPTVLAPVVSIQRADKPAPRWMPMAAAAAGVAVVAWVALSGINTQQSASPVIAAAQPQTQQIALKATARQDDDRPYLMAHQAYGPGVQMAGVSGYVRPVSLDEPIASR